MKKSALIKNLFSPSTSISGIQKTRHALLAGLFWTGSLLGGGIALAQNSPSQIANGSTGDLTNPATYTSDTLPGTTSDVYWASGITYAPTAYTLTSTNGLSIGTLDDLDGTQTLTVADASGSAGGIILNGGTNEIAPSTSDLLYVASGGTLTLTGGTGTTALELELAAGGNFDIAGTANIGSVIADSGTGFTKTGAGTLTLSGASTYSGGTTIDQGTILAGINSAGTAGSPTSGALGTGTVTLGYNSGTSNASLLTNGAFTVGNNITVASGDTGTLTLGGNANGNSYFTGAITLDNNLTVTQAGTGTTTLQGNITSGASGTQTITFNSANAIYQNTGVIGGGTGTIAIVQAGTGTLYFNGTAANTFTGGIAVDAGSIEAINADGSEFGATTNVITLGNSSGAAVSILLGNVSGHGAVLDQAVTVSGTGTNLISSISGNGSQIPFIANEITLNSENLTLNATAAGGFRLLGGVTGTGNLTFQANSTGSLALFVVGGLSANDTINNAGTITNSGTGMGTLSTGAGAGTNPYFGSAVTSLIQDSSTSFFIIDNNNSGQFVGTAQVLLGTMELQNANALNVNNAVSVASGATLDVQNVSQTIAGLNNVSGSGGTVTDSTGTAVRTLTLGGSGTYSFAGSITATTAADMAVAKSGTGTQTLSGNSTYAGGTTISGGVLFADNATSSTGTGAVLVNSGTLGGTGTIAPTGVTSGTAVNIASGAFLSPSNGGANGAPTFSTLTFSLAGTSTLNLASGSKFVFDLGAAGAPGTSSDLVDVLTGTLTLNSQNITDFTFNQEAGFGAGTYTLMETSAEGDLLGSLGSVLTETQNGYTETLSEDPDQYLILTVTTAPEPSAWAMLAGGLVLLVCVQRRRRRASDISAN